MDKSQEEFIEEVIAKALRDAGYHVPRLFSGEESAPSAHGLDIVGRAGTWQLTLSRS